MGGWDLLALRLYGARHPGSALNIPEPTVTLFATHTEAALHGLEDVGDMSHEAVAAAERLIRKYPRLERTND